tara:strand:- start:6361 stop:6768 length:408 start_codon:yes stop_codon:yes gene_type:complete
MPRYSQKSRTRRAAEGTGIAALVVGAAAGLYFAKQMYDENQSLKNLNALEVQNYQALHEMGKNMNDKLYTIDDIARAKRAASRFQRPQSMITPPEEYSLKDVVMAKKWAGKLHGKEITPEQIAAAKIAAGLTADE